MPTCISVDNCICHFSPLRSDTPVYLKDGQLVKVIYSNSLLKYQNAHEWFMQCCAEARFQNQDFLFSNSCFLVSFTFLNNHEEW